MGLKAGTVWVWLEFPASFATRTYKGSVSDLMWDTSVSVHSASGSGNTRSSITGVNPGNSHSSVVEYMLTCRMFSSSYLSQNFCLNPWRATASQCRVDYTELVGPMFWVRRRQLPVSLRGTTFSVQLHPFCLSIPSQMPGHAACLLQLLTSLAPGCLIF